MTKELERMKEIEERKGELRKEIAEGKADEKRLAEIKKEAEALSSEQDEFRSKMDLEKNLEPAAVPAQKRNEQNADSAAEKFRKTNRMSIPMFKESRAVLVSSGKLATPTVVSTEIGELPQVISSIVDDVDTIDATGTGEWTFPYKTEDAEVDDVTEGEEIGGTGAKFDKVAISPSEWGVLDEVSNQVNKMTNVAYASAVQNSAYLALRKKAKVKITNAILNSKLAETRTGIKIDQDYVRMVVLGFDSDESVAGGTKLYINKADLAALGKVRGTNDKKALFDIEFDDENNGKIKEGGTVIPFSINSTVPEGTQIYGQPKAVKMLLWGDYEVSTDQGGDYFKRNMMGVRGLATAGADLVKYHGMQLIKQADA